MNRQQRRHPSESAKMKQLLENMNAVKEFNDIISGDWPIKEGDKVQLDLETIKKHPCYEQRMPAYQKFCEENAGKIFTAVYDKSLRPSVVCLAEDKTEPKWLFWIGDLKKVN